MSIDYVRRNLHVHAVDDASLSLYQKQFVAILGPSGCGKSSLLMALAGLRQPTSGAVFVDDEKINAPYPGLGMAFQRDLLAPWRTVRQNVLLQIELMGLPVRNFRSRCEDLLGIVGLRGFEDNYPNELSGGMRQRVALCRALIHDPTVLLMDEPFGALDALTREQIHVDVERICSQSSASTTFVTHSIDEAVYLADQVVVMSSRPGRIVKRIHIDISRPRKLADRELPEFTAYVGEARRALEQEGALHND